MWRGFRGVGARLAAQFFRRQVIFSCLNHLPKGSRFRILAHTASQSSDSDFNDEAGGSIRVRHQFHGLVVDALARENLWGRVTLDTKYTGLSPENKRVGRFTRGLRLGKLSLVSFTCYAGDIRRERGRCFAVAVRHTFCIHRTYSENDD